MLLYIIIIEYRMANREGQPYYQNRILLNKVQKYAEPPNLTKYSNWQILILIQNQNWFSATSENLFYYSYFIGRSSS